ncbi:MAG: hypothetical protein U1D41_14475 [Nitrosomonas sp.]|uniref:hypothetical protein n=1 Tax=Nitrosomonas sp. TaxID=42353 RepID=UPI0027327823|nr:hypothetical protein [Nitrosomonas sp.]MDP3282789.1 hypothetical protein [Nitrosomonas sp.]MDP3665015.1 hypothetical protein [Nitrosomonas sp.]MDZ4107332.1 hypothetical protein [Nitrosomonas sp.]
MKQSKIQDNFKAENFLSEWKANHKFIETGQVRRAKLHAARLIDVIDGEKGIFPSSTLHQLLEVSLFLKTTDSEILAAYLKRPPAIIRTEIQRIRTILGEYQRNTKVSIDQAY